MIEADQFGLGGFELVESSEAGMLSAVQQAAGRKAATSSSSAGSRIR